jgi:hypothetical protein
VNHGHSNDQPHNGAGHITSIMFPGTKSYKSTCGMPLSAASALPPSEMRLVLMSSNSWPRLWCASRHRRSPRRCSPAGWGWRWAAARRTPLRLPRSSARRADPWYLIEAKRFVTAAFHAERHAAVRGLDSQAVQGGDRCLPVRLACAIGRRLTNGEPDRRPEDLQASREPQNDLSCLHPEAQG